MVNGPERRTLLDFTLDPDELPSLPEPSGSDRANAAQDFARQSGVSPEILSQLDQPNRAEIENVVVKDKILTQKVLKPWQRELAGVIKDPSYTFLNTASKQAHLNYTLKYMRDLNKMGSQAGPGKFVFDAFSILFMPLTIRSNLFLINSKTSSGIMLFSYASLTLKSGSITNFKKFHIKNPNLNHLNLGRQIDLLKIKFSTIPLS